MADEPHDAVRLLLARMESHPEEFRFKEGAYHDRWYNHITAINSYGNDADKAALNTKIRDVRMAEVHEQIMEELCNGPENRRKEEEEAEYERNLIMQKARQIPIALNTGPFGQAHQNAYTHQLGQYNQAQGLTGKSLTSVLLDEYSDIPSEPNYISEIKQALGIKIRKKG